jgi:hypothetical protein
MSSISKRPMKIGSIFSLKGLWLAALIFLSISPAWAIPYYWVAPSGAQVWNDPQNWSLTSGGSGGAGVPGLDDDAIFDNNGAGDCFVDITGLEVESLTFEAGFGGLIDLGSTTLSTQQIVNFQTPMQNGVVRVLGGRIQIETSNLAIELNGITDDLNLLSNTIQNVTLTVTGATLNSVTSNTFTSTIDFSRTGPGVLVFESNSFQDVTLRNQNNVGSIRPWDCCAKNRVAGNLVAFACKTSFTNGLHGFVSFFSKTKLIGHYEKSLGAYLWD